MVDLQKPLDLDSDDAKKLLPDLQGNILKYHGRPYAAHLILHFGSDPNAAREWIARFAKNKVTSAEEQRQAARRREGEFFAMFLLSAAGYRTLGLAEFLPAAETDPFVRGMKNPWRPIKDPAPDEWEWPYHDEVHAMILLAHEDRARLNTEVTALEAELLEGEPKICDWVHVEKGEKLTKKFGNQEIRIEHFGFADGISQPLLIQQDIDEEIRKRGNSRWDPSAPLALALVREPGEVETYGSFMVFRKLEQNVRGFNAAVKALAEMPGFEGDQEKAAAYTVGRYKSGTPLVPSAVLEAGAFPNDFKFKEDDPNGALCPFHAHIRKTNPRGDTNTYLGRSEAFERTKRIIRRGITYGARPDLAEDASESVEIPEKGVGVLFMSFQAVLDNFALMQMGCDSNNFVRRTIEDGVDAVTGRHQKPAPQTWPTNAGTVKFTIANYVTLKGGEYFFAPSLPFLKGLSADI